MGLYKYYDPATGTRKPIKAGSIVNMDGTNEVTPDDFVAHKAESATTSQKGHVQLSSSTSSTSTSLAATARAVKTVNDALTSHQADYVQHTKATMPHLTADGGFRWGLRINQDLSATLLFEEVE